MATVINPEVAQELQSAVRALEPHGFALVATEGSGMMFTADFRKQDTIICIVKDRGYWSVDCDAVLGASRKSQSAAVRDALDWITKHDA